MNKREGFTLIELLATLVILGIILGIAVPTIIGLIKNSTRSAFQSDAKMVIQAISYKEMENKDFNPLEVTKENMQDTLGISSDNYAQVNIAVSGETTSIILVGQNKWTGFTAYGTTENMKVVNTDDYDIIPPAITIKGDNPAYVGRGTTYSDEGATATDDKDGDVAITSTIIKNKDGNVVTSVDTSAFGTYTITYTAVDKGGNGASSVRRVNIIDRTNPVITLIGSSSVTLDIGSTYSDAGATALDDVDGNVTDKMSVTGMVNPSIPGSYTITYNVSDSNGNAAITVTRIVNVFEYNYAFGFTGSLQTFTTPHTGNYKIELWGAQGGGTYGAKGGYTSGIINLANNQTLYMYVGQQASQPYGGWNGGANMVPSGITVSGSRQGSSGGGATDVRLTSGAWDNFSSLMSRIMVAGGGGGYGYGEYSASGVGGGLTGGSGSGTASVCSTSPATQTSGGLYSCGSNATNQGSFGIGGTTIAEVSTVLTTGGSGGGGYYGGGGNVSVGTDYQNMGSGSGGSSFISGYSGCNAISSSSTSTNIISTGQPNHYSGMVFANGVMIAGNASMPSTGGGAETGHTDNGYAKVTYIP